MSSLVQVLSRPPYCLCVASLSIDDFYLEHDAQKALAAKHPSNPLLQHRGQPSTHDTTLLKDVIESLLSGSETLIPSYDKSAYGGEGDREPRSKWRKLNAKGEEGVAVIILEGWCIGFEPLEAEPLRSKWQAAVALSQMEGYQGRLGLNRFEDIVYINTSLADYAEVFRYERYNQSAPDG